MASKADRFYFENFIAAAEASCRAAAYLSECLGNYQPKKLPEMLREMHAIENTGDECKHAMSAALARAFVTPIDREDLALVSQNIDEVTDHIEEVLQNFYMNHVTHAPAAAIDFAGRIEHSCRLMQDIMREFSNFKKSSKLHEMVIQLNHYEEECDRLYLEAVHALRDTYSDPLEIFSMREIYECLEACADACEHVGECVETVIMKNT